MLETMVKPRQDLVTVNEDTTLSEALMLLEDFNFRALPILDASGQLFRGVVYKMHLYKHKANNGDMQQPVTSVMRNTTKFINSDATFFDLTFAIRDLPFISVLDAENHFTGIITYSHYMRLLEDSWRPNDGKTVMTLKSTGGRGNLERASKIMARYTNILSVVTLNTDHGPGRIIATIPTSVDDSTLNKITRALQRKDFEIESIESYSRPSA